MDKDKDKDKDMDKDNMYFYSNLLYVPPSALRTMGYIFSPKTVWKSDKIYDLLYIKMYWKILIASLIHTYNSQQ